MVTIDDNMVPGYTQDMAELIKNIIVGMRDVLVIWPDDEYIRPSKRDFCNDMQALRRDAGQVATSLRSKLEEYGQTHSR